MRASPKVIVFGAVLLLLAALTGWAWVTFLELSWTREERSAPASRVQPWLGATWLLRDNGFGVQTVTSIDLLDVRKLRDGTLLLGGAQGVITKTKGEQLLAWVARGNTLLFEPREATKEELRIQNEMLAEAEAEPESDEEAAPEDAAVAAAEQGASVTDVADEEQAADAHEHAHAEEETEAEPQAHDEDAEEPAADEVETDALSAAFPVRAARVSVKAACGNLSGHLERKDSDAAADKKCPAGSVRGFALREVDLPGAGLLVFDAQSIRLKEIGEDSVPLWRDKIQDSLRSYQYGKGQVIMAPGHLFRNEALRHHDHGALLLGLARLNGAHKHVTIVKSRTIVPWYSLLWMHYQMLLMALAALAALLFWHAVRRFGPLLPDPAPARRSLMEHIDASGAWLWKASGGRQVLIDAARADLQATLQRRAPALLRLPETQQHDELARQCGLTAAAVAAAMHYEPARFDHEFTRQIRTLQILRKHHER